MTSPNVQPTYSEKLRIVIWHIFMKLMALNEWLINYEIMPPLTLGNRVLPIVPHSSNNKCMGFIPLPAAPCSMSFISWWLNLFLCGYLKQYFFLLSEKREIYWYPDIFFLNTVRAPSKAALDLKPQILSFKKNQEITSVP